MTKFRHWRLMATLALGASLTVAAGGCDWLQAGFSAGGDNANPYEAALTSSTVGSLTQRYTLGSSIPPIVADGILYSVTSSGAVSAVRASDGLPIWTATLPAGAASGVADDSGTVFASAPGTLYALNAANGAVRWSDPIAGLSGAPVIDAGKIFVETVTTDSASAPPFFLYDDSVIAIDPTSGTTLWTSSGFQSNDAPSRPIAGAGTVAVNFTITGTPGTPSYNEPEIASFSETNGSGGTIGEAKVLMVGNGFAMLGLATNGQVETEVIDTSTGTTLWSVPGFSGAPDAMSADLLVGGLTALNPTTGATKWTASLPSGTTITARPVIAGTLVYLVGTNGTSSTLYAFDGATGSQVAAVPVAGGAATSSQLVISEGMVFVTVNGTITAYAPTS